MVQSAISTQPTRATISVLAFDGKSYLQTGIIPNFVRPAESDERTGTYAELRPEQRRQRRRDDVLAARAVQAVYSDIFITERAYLRAATWQVADGLLIVTPEEALPLVSLYLRRQNHYYSWRPLDAKGSMTMNRGLFYWVGARELLSAGWRWFTAYLQHSRAVGDDRIVFLAQSLFQRVQRALQARDECHGALNVPQDNDTADAALAALDDVLLGLMGAVDVSARIVHHTLGLDESQIRNAGWQRKDWIKQVRKADVPLASIVAPGTRHCHALTILSSLRNSVHGEALSALAVVSAPARRDGTLVGLPHDDGARLVQAMDALGGHDEWGIDEVLPGSYHADPGRLLDAVFGYVVALLNDVQTATPVERLQGVLLHEDDELPPDDGVFNATTRSSVRWQLGL